MILKFKDRAAVVRCVPEALHVGMAVGEMLHRAAGDVSRNCKDTSPAATSRPSALGLRGRLRQRGCERQETNHSNRGEYRAGPFH